MARWSTSLLLLVLPACSGAQPSPACTDQQYAIAAAECVALVNDCLDRGNSEDACSAACDRLAEDWRAKCR